MQKKDFATLIMSTVGGILFALGMCMALVPEWGAMVPGIVIGAIGGGNPIGHDPCSSEDGRKACHCFQWEGNRDYPAWRIWSHCPWRRHVYDYGMELDGPWHHRWNRRYYRPALSDSRYQGFEMRCLYEQIDRFDGSRNHRSGRDCNRCMLFGPQT